MKYRSRRRLVRPRLVVNPPAELKALMFHRLQEAANHVGRGSVRELVVILGTYDGEVHLGTAYLGPDSIRLAGLLSMAHAQAVTGA